MSSVIFTQGWNKFEKFLEVSLRGEKLG